MAQSREQAFDALKKCAGNFNEHDARDFFAAEPDRLDQFVFEAGGLSLDASKQAISSAALDALVGFAEASHVPEAIAALASGARLNVTEDRAASHMALRGAGSDKEALNLATAEMEQACAFAEAVRSGTRRGSTGKRFKTILHIGIGGSDLGPRLVYKALKPHDMPISIRFLASPDPENFQRVSADLDPEETLVFVVSKSFGTAETKANAIAARDWLAAGLGENDIAAHLVSATASPSAAQDFGVPEDSIFSMWDWVGGRYSLWSAVSLSVMCALGPKLFRELLAGAAVMDQHFIKAPLAGNMPVMMALTGFWNRVIRQQGSQAVVPFATPLALVPAWLQQLSMESLGKRVSPTGSDVSISTGAVIWGAEGPNGQHAFFQMLHQGSDAIPADLIAVAKRDGERGQSRMMIANVLAQAEALLKGRSLDDARAELSARGVSAREIERLAPHMVMPGGRPTSLIVLDQLDAGRVGALLALYEHSVFVQSVLFDVNAFDQYGVELGKSLAFVLEDELETGRIGLHDPSTQHWLARLSAQRD